MRQDHFWAKILPFFFLIITIFNVMAYSYVSVFEAKQMAENGEASIIDVRQAQYYEEGHIPGALLMSLDNLESLVRSGRAPVAISDTLILYCDCPSEESSIMAATILAHYGYSKIHVMKGGWQAWKDASFPIVEGKEPGTLRKTKTPQTLPPYTTRPPSFGEKGSSPPFLFLLLLILGVCAVGMVLVYVYIKNRR